eukprot:scaffold8015_cov149-Isochrysis_galbana.AAC.1
MLRAARSTHARAGACFHTPCRYSGAALRRHSPLDNRECECPVFVSVQRGRTRAPPSRVVHQTRTTVAPVGAEARVGSPYQIMDLGLRPTTPDALPCTQIVQENALRSGQVSHRATSYRRLPINCACEHGLEVPYRASSIHRLLEDFIRAPSICIYIRCRVFVFVCGCGC